MTGRYGNGFDWLTASISTAATQALLEAEGWYFFNFAGTLQPISPGRFGYGNRLHFFEGGTGALSTSLMVRPAAGGINAPGGWVSMGMNFATVSNGFAIVGVFDGVNNFPQVVVGFGPNGVVSVWTGNPVNNNMTLLGSSEVGAFPFGVDFDMEAFLKVNATTGEVQVRINTVPVLHLTNQNTLGGGSNAYFDSYCVGWHNFGSGAVFDFTIDDLRYYDTLGSINNTWLGTARVQTCLVAGNGPTIDFTRSNTGLANWQNLLNHNVDDTLYLFDPTTSDFNLSTIQPLVNSPLVFWGQVTSFVRQDDATQRTVKNRVVSAGTTGDGAVYATSQTYAADTDVYELDPHTGIQFTGAGFNAIDIGLFINS